MMNQTHQLEGVDGIEYYNERILERLMELGKVLNWRTETRYIPQQQVQLAV